MAGQWPEQRRGHRGENVRTVQHLLVQHGQHIVVDRVFGPQTEDAVRRFQRDRGLGVDGIVGNRTWPALIVTAIAPVVVAFIAERAGDPVALATVAIFGTLALVCFSLVRRP